jgi:hypothetical protein
MADPALKYEDDKNAEGSLYREAPNNIEAEQALLGAILVNNDAFYRVSDFLKPEHFYEPLHRQTYAVAADQIRMGKISNPVTIKTFLPAEEKLGDIHRRAISCAARRRGGDDHQRGRLRPCDLRFGDPPRVDRNRRGHGQHRV